jgi:hypothetical protein
MILVVVVVVMIDDDDDDDDNNNDNDNKDGDNNDDNDIFFLITGLTAFDYIVDFEEWIESGYFSEEIKARLKGLLNNLVIFFKLGTINTVEM